MRNINRIVKELESPINVTDYFDLTSLTPEQKKFLSTDLRVFISNKNFGSEFNKKK